MKDPEKRANAAQTAAQSAILHDAYFNRPPNLIMLLIIRLILLCAFSASAVWCLTDLYLLPEDQLLLCLTAAGASGVFFLLLSIFPSGIVYFASAAVTGVTCWLLRDPLWERLTFFWDKMILRLDSRLITAKPLLIHAYGRLTGGYYSEKLHEGWITGMLLVSLLIAFVFTCCVRTRFRALPAAALFGVLAAPAFVAEISGFHISFAAFISIFAAFITIDVCYELDGRLVFGKPRAARDALRRNENSYRKRTRMYLLGKKLRSDLPRYFKYNASSITALIVAAGVLAAASYIIPEGQGFDYEAFFNSVIDAGVTVADNVGGVLGVNFGTVEDSGYFSYSHYGDIAGGIGISEPAQGNLPVMDAVLDRNDISVYLRGDIGVDYRGDSWSAIRDEFERFKDDRGISYSDWFAAFYPDLQYQVLRQRLSSLGYNPDRLFPLQNVSLTYRRNTKVVFQPLAPYELTYKTDPSFESFGDYVLRVRQGKGYLKTFESLSLTPNMDNPYMTEAITSAQYSTDLAWTLPGGMENAEYSAYVGKYREFADKAYTASDPSVYALINDMRQRGYIGGLSAFDTASGMCRYFKENFTYSLDTDNGSAEKSLESFLYNTRSGHCALFATAMTLAMRELGIPARYVTGYVISGPGERTSDGRYLYTLRENDLHAWVEVYFDNAGWLPFDPTAAVSGYGGTEIIVDVPPDPEYTTVISEITPVSEVSDTDAEQFTDEPAVGDDAETVTTSDTDTTMPPPEDDPDFTGTYEPPDSPEEPYTGKSPGEIFVELLPYLTFAAVFIALIVTAVLFVRGVRKAEDSALRGFRKKPADKAAAEMYRLVIELLSREGLPPGAETITDYAVRADNSPLLKGSNVFLTDVMPVFMKCEFGRPEISPVTEEERLALLKFTMALYRRVMDKKSFIGRFFTKISLFL